MLQLNDKYFSVVSKEGADNTFKYRLHLNAAHEVYKGHFPGNPISPGVCSIQTIRECCEDALHNRLTIRSIKLCRFSTLLTPTKCTEITVGLSITPNANDYTVVADITNGDETFVSFKGTLERQ